MIVKFVFFAFSKIPTVETLFETFLGDFDKKGAFDKKRFFSDLSFIDNPTT